MSLARLYEIRVDSLQLESFMNQGDGHIGSKIQYSANTGLVFSAGGKDESKYILGRAPTVVEARDDDNQLLDLKCTFLARFDFDDNSVSVAELESFVRDKDYCDKLTLQLIPILNEKIADLVKLSGLDMESPLNAITFRAKF